ncbi:hypothetical protein L1787_07705 [Acuticoccus sp. M5D2P5]|uniref:hypothetical protein n=1 Tax=Acuticoccus kalidii TaxID=2910977 RepID=UPI001F3716B1|nr:hypothetical protein [Acuticoccus kalidii]MCF3933295.1 hypothetical protein [Acuticoccus kalidii]
MDDEHETPPAEPKAPTSAKPARKAKPTRAVPERQPRFTREALERMGLDPAPYGYKKGR